MRTATPQYGHADTVRVLAELRADLHRPMPDGGVPLHAAAYFGHTEAAAALLELRAMTLSDDFCAPQRALALGFPTQQ